MRTPHNIQNPRAYEYTASSLILFIACRITATHRRPLRSLPCSCPLASRRRCRGGRLDLFSAFDRGGEASRTVNRGHSIGCAPRSGPGKRTRTAVVRAIGGWLRLSILPGPPAVTAPEPADVPPDRRSPDCPV